MQAVFMLLNVFVADRNLLFYVQSVDLGQRQESGKGAFFKWPLSVK